MAGVSASVSICKFIFIHSTHFKARVQASKFVFCLIFLNQFSLFLSQAYKYSAILTEEFNLGI